MIRGSLFGRFSSCCDGTALFIQPSQIFDMWNRIHYGHFIMFQETAQFLSQFIKIGSLYLNDIAFPVNIGHIAVHRNLMIIRIRLHIMLYNSMNRLLTQCSDSLSVTLNP